jgi:DNA-binding MarR family transcriptional regulator
VTGLSVSSLPGHLARRFHQISTALFDLEVRRAGLDLTPVQYAALVAVQDHPSIDQATLAGLIAYDRTTIGGVVDRLVDKGLVTRVTNDADRRAKVLSTTEAGHAAIKRAGPAVLKAQEQLTSGLSVEEAETLIRLMEKAVVALGDVSRSSR